MAKVELLMPNLLIIRHSYFICRGLFIPYCINMLYLKLNFPLLIIILKKNQIFLPVVDEIFSKFDITFTQQMIQVLN